MSDKEMKNTAEFFLNTTVPNTTDYTIKYRLCSGEHEAEIIESRNVDENRQESNVQHNKISAEMVAFLLFYKFRETR